MGTQVEAKIYKYTNLFISTSQQTKAMKIFNFLLVAEQLLFVTITRLGKIFTWSRYWPDFIDSAT